jgi:hypothetical protein
VDGDALAGFSGDENGNPFGRANVHDPADIFRYQSYGMDHV